MQGGFFYHVSSFVCLHFPLLSTGLATGGKKHFIAASSMGDKSPRLRDRGRSWGEVKGSSERSPSEEKRKTNGIVGMRSIWLYSLSGQVQEKRIAEEKAFRFYEQAIERLSKP